MKYLAALCLFFSLSSLAQEQEEIFFQTRPEGRYVISYTSGDYTFLFDYSDFLKEVVWNPKERADIEQFIDGRISAQGFVEINGSGQRFVMDGEETNLETITSDTEIAHLIEKGNLIVQDRSGKAALNSILATHEIKVPTRSEFYVYTHPETGEQLFKRKLNFFVGSGCPSF